MGNPWTSLSRRARFGLLVLGFSGAFLALGLALGEDVALQLQKTHTTPNGWIFFGWLVGGPPYMLTALFWAGHRRLTHDQFRNRSLLLAPALGLTFLILPARIIGVPEQFGTGGIVGYPLSAGLVWGLCATVTAGVFGGLVLLVLRSATPHGASAAQKQMTTRFLEVACIIALIVTLGLGLYGGDGSGIFNNGT